MDISELKNLAAKRDKPLECTQVSVDMATLEGFFDSLDKKFHASADTAKQKELALHMDGADMLIKSLNAKQEIEAAERTRA